MESSRIRLPAPSYPLLADGTREITGLCALVRSCAVAWYHMTQLMVYQLAARTDAGVAGRHESYMAKIAGTELATEMPISQMWRDARSFMITEGPVEVMRMVLAREIFRGQV